MNKKVRALYQDIEDLKYCRALIYSCSALYDEGETLREVLRDIDKLIENRTREIDTIECREVDERAHPPREGLS